MYTEKKKISNAKYDKMHIKRLNLSTKTEEYSTICDTAQKYNMSLSLFCRKCIKYCIDNEIDVKNIDL